LKDLKSLGLLDLSSNANIDLQHVTAFTQLETLVLQNLDLSQVRVSHLYDQRSAMFPTSISCA
jgi:hypothetical protein